MNYDSTKRGPCTLLKKCNLVEGATNTESFLSNDVADSLTIDETDDDTTTSDDDDGPLSDMSLGELFGFVILFMLIIALIVWIFYATYPVWRSLCYSVRFPYN